MAALAPIGLQKQANHCGSHGRRRDLAAFPRAPLAYTGRMWVCDGDLMALAGQRWPVRESSTYQDPHRPLLKLH